MVPNVYTVLKCENVAESGS